MSVISVSGNSLMVAGNSLAVARLVEYVQGGGATFEHFTTVIVRLPYCTTCTLPSGSTLSQGYHTPMTCVEASDATYNYVFGTYNVPLWFRDEYEGSTIENNVCLLYTSPSPRDGLLSRMPSSA